jgi:hypothetical protein
MRTTKGFFVLMLALTLAAPAPVFGQSAGDEQYTDPFSQDESTGGGQQGGDGSQPQPEEQPAPTPAPAPETAIPEPATGSVESAQQDTGSVAPSSTNTLPATGLPGALLAALGAGLLLGGAALQRAAR